MSNEKKLFWDKKKAVTLLLLILTITMIFVYHDYKVEIHQDKTIQPATAQFIISSGWDYPDEYGQGIDRIFVMENSTGSWVNIGVASYPDGRNTVLDWNVSVGIKLRLYCKLNETLTGATDVVDGENYLRHSVIVTSGGQTVFSQQNFTWYDSGDYGSDIYDYEYHVVLNFLPLEGQSYTVTVTYETYYEHLAYGDPYFHDCSDTSDITYHSNGGLDPSDYGIGSNGSVVEIWILLDSAVNEYVIYKLDFPNLINTDGDINLTVRYRVEDIYIGFRLDLYYTDATSDSTGLRFSQTWANLSIDADTGKTLDYALLYCDDTPASVSSGNRSVYVDFIEITNPSGNLIISVDQWDNAGIAILLFPVLYDPWALHVLIIFFGLGMIPVSVIYLVKGGKDGMSMDKVFYGIVVFIFGWALFLGGIFG